MVKWGCYIGNIPICIICHRSIPGISRIILSMKIPYPAVGSLISTWVTAPTIFPFWQIGEPDTSVVK